MTSKKMWYVVLDNFKPATIPTAADPTWHQCVFDTLEAATEYAHLWLGMHDVPDLPVNVAVEYYDDNTVMIKKLDFDSIHDEFKQEGFQNHVMRRLTDLMRDIGHPDWEMVSSSACRLDMLDCTWDYAIIQAAFETFATDLRKRIPGQRIHALEPEMDKMLKEAYKDED